MTDAEPTVGVDACPAGWLATEIADAGIQTKTFENFGEVVETFSDAGCIFVDIPVGLPQTDRRRCDEEASDLLGCRGNSVFYPPCQSAIELSDHEEASQEQRAKIGHGLSQQAHNIGPKIRQVAAAVGDKYDGLVRESHPELCFAALNGQPIAYSKSSDWGRGLRMKLLCDELDTAREHYRDVRDRYFLKDVGRDDILDSMVLAVAARRSGIATVPNSPTIDEPRIYYPNFETPRLSVD